MYIVAVVLFVSLPLSVSPGTNEQQQQTPDLVELVLSWAKASSSSFFFSSSFVFLFSCLNKKRDRFPLHPTAEQTDLPLGIPKIHTRRYKRKEMRELVLFVFVVVVVPADSSRPNYIHMPIDCYYYIRNDRCALMAGCPYLSIHLSRSFFLISVRLQIHCVHSRRTHDLTKCLYYPRWTTTLERRKCPGHFSSGFFFSLNNKFHSLMQL